MVYFVLKLLTRFLAHEFKLWLKVDCSVVFFFRVFALQHFTQYIPLAVCELHVWMGSPSIYVFDCSNAGCIVDYIRKNTLRDQQDAVNIRYTIAYMQNVW